MILSSFFWRQIHKIRFMKKYRTPQESVWICQSSRQCKKPVAGVNMQVSLQFARPVGNGMDPLDCLVGTA